MAGSGSAHLRTEQETLLRAEHMVVEFPLDAKRKVHAVSDVSFDVAERETFSLVGESGCGKSTVGRSIVRLQPLTSGRIRFQELALSELQGETLRRVRPRLQIIFQDPIGALNPRHRIGDIVAEPLRIWGREHDSDRRKRADEVLVQVGLSPRAVRDKKPHELSGGQCQRVAIARALILKPAMIVCDEPVSSLDVSIQAQVLNLLKDMKDLYGLTIIFISHDLAVVRSISDRVAVMYLGKLCEVSADLEDLYSRPAHPYTAMLLSAVPNPDPNVGRPPHIAAPEPPSPIAPPSGCRFRTRCPFSQERCAVEEPVMRRVTKDRYVACHFPLLEPEAIA
jgi:peptide/nickel transport system ATP-binding protein